MARIPQDFIDELLTRADIVEIIDARVPLKKKGREFAACCPFHGEKTPSFYVSPAKQFYHCFGCGAHGTVLSFLMEYDRLEFPEAVRQLAEHLGLEVPQEARDDVDDSRKPLYALMAQAAQLYQQALRSEARAVDYLKGRGLTGEICKDYGIGYAPDAWDTVLSKLGDGPNGVRQLEAAGLVIAGRQGRHYDRFRDRVIFPIRDTRGRVIAFGGRILDKGEPKYLNSPETPLFHKGRQLYGLYEARQALRDLPRLMVVEGYMDVVALAQYGVRYAVATLGTATTPEHLDRLFRYTREVVFCFDGDNAGRRAAWRALDNALAALRDGRQIRFLFLPEGEDPDTLVRKEGREAFEARLEAALPLSEFMFRELSAQADPSSVEGRAQLVELAKPLLAKVTDPVYQTLLEKALAELTHVESARLSMLMGSQSKPQARRRPRGAPAMTPMRRAIVLLLNAPELAESAGDPDWLRQLALPGAPLLADLVAYFIAHPGARAAQVLEAWREREAGGHLARLAEVPLTTPEGGMRHEFTGLLAGFRRDQRHQRLNELEKRGFGALSEAEKTEFRRLHAELAGLPESQR